MSEIDPILIGKGENPARNTSKHPAVINRSSRKKLFAEYEHHARTGDQKSDPGLLKGLNTYQGHLTYQAVAEAFDMPHTPYEP